MGTVNILRSPSQYGGYVGGDSGPKAGFNLDLGGSPEERIAKKRLKLDEKRFDWEREQADRVFDENVRQADLAHQQAIWADERDRSRIDIDRQQADLAHQQAIWADERDRSRIDIDRQRANQSDPAYIAQAALEAEKNRDAWVQQVRRELTALPPTATRREVTDAYLTWVAEKNAAWKDIFAKSAAKTQDQIAREGLRGADEALRMLTNTNKVPGPEDVLNSEGDFIKSVRDAVFTPPPGGARLGTKQSAYEMFESGDPLRGTPYENLSTPMAQEVITQKFRDAGFQQHFQRYLHGATLAAQEALNQIKPFEGNEAAILADTESLFKSVDTYRTQLTTMQDQVDDALSGLQGITTLGLRKQIQEMRAKGIAEPSSSIVKNMYQTLPAGMQATIAGSDQDESFGSGFGLLATSRAVQQLAAQMHVQAAEAEKFAEKDPSYAGIASVIRQAADTINKDASKLVQRARHDPVVEQMFTTFTRAVINYNIIENQHAQKVKGAFNEGQ